MISINNYHYLQRLAKRTTPLFKRNNRFREIMKRKKNDNANVLITEYLKSQDPFMVGRLGSVETRFLLNYQLKNNVSSDFEGIIKTLTGKIGVYWKQNDAFFDALCFNAGYFPKEKKDIDRFVRIYTESTSEINVLGIWNELEEFIDIPDETILCKIRELEPWFYENPWSNELKGKKVLVIHPFEDDIKKQYQNREKLYINQNVLPEFELVTLRAIQTIADEKSEFESWFEALDYMKNRIDEIEFDVAIIGAGAYGLPLAAHIKNIRKQAIHLGGVTQLLFGIKGKRWEEWKHYTNLRKENGNHWIFPSEKATPKNFKGIEGGSYW